jgi:hypothetical protein
MISQPKATHRRLLSLPPPSMTHVFVLTIVAGIFVVLNMSPIVPNDFWWHLQAGREIARTGQIPLGDALAFTIPGKPYPNYRAFWLIDLCLYELYAAGGPAFVVFVYSLVVTSAYGLLLWLCSRIAGDGRNGYRCTLLAAAVGCFSWTVRPQFIAFPLFVAFLAVIYEYRRRPRPGWLVVFPIVMLVWVNSHGSYVLGLLLLGIWLLDEGWLAITASSRDDRRRLNRLIAPSAALCIAILACLLNPRGLGAFTYLVTMLGDPVSQTLGTEWAASSFAYQDGVIFLTVLLLSATLLIISPKRASFFQLLMLLSFAILSLKGRRYAIWFGFVAATVLADHLPAILASARRIFMRPGGRMAAPPGGTPARDLLNYLLAGMVLLTTLVTLPWFKLQLPLPEANRVLLSPKTPIEATRFLLEKHPAGRLYNFADFGSYLIWAAQPEYPVFIDLRLEMYSLEFVKEYVLISNAIGDWEHELEGYGVKILMLSPQEQPELVKAASQSAHWEQIYSDQAAVIFVRSVPSGQ